MIEKKDIHSNQYHNNRIDKHSIILEPHKSLLPFIANYTFTCPCAIPEWQVVLPTASSTLVCGIGRNDIINRLRGVNTKPTTIGHYARQFDFMFLVEFQPAGLYPFLKIDQNHLADNSFLFDELGKSLNRQITEAYYTSDDIFMLTLKLDSIFMSRLDAVNYNATFDFAMKKVLASKGNIRMRELSGEVYYSEKQLNRLFQKYIGANGKTFARIVRMKNALDMMSAFIDTDSVIEQTGHYDYAHFIHDFKGIYGITPKEYTDKMSLFYNDQTKLLSYN